MNILNIGLILYIVFDNAILFTNAANLFDAVGGILGIGNGNGNPPLPNLVPPNNQYREPPPNYNNNNFNNRPNNNQFVPNPSFNNNNNFPRPNNNFGRPPNGNSNFGRPNNNNFGRPPNNNFNNGQLVPTRDNDGLTDEERRAAEKFPGIKKLLDQLRELNRLKEQQKQKENGQNGGNGGTNNGNNIDDNNTTEDNTNDDVAMNGWKIIRKPKFVFQAKPVRPENEVESENEVVYYLGD